MFNGHSFRLVSPRFDSSDDSKQRDEQPREAVAQFFQDWGGFEGLAGDFAALGAFVPEEFAQAGGEGAIVESDVELEIEAQAARIPVRGADEAPHTVDEEDFRVIKGRR